MSSTLPTSSRVSAPTSPTRRKPSIPPGFRATPKPKPRAVADMTVRELQDLHNLNAKILASPSASVSTYVQRVSAEQAAIKARLVELDGMETINTGLKHANIRGESDMCVDPPLEAPVSRTLEAKRKALSQFPPANGTTAITSLSLQEAIDLERQAHARDMERQQRIFEKKQRPVIPQKGDVLVRQEREAQIWAYMNHKSTDSDLEDDEDDDSDNDPSTWFEDDQDNGWKGQDIVEPDIDIEDVDSIRVNAGYHHNNMLYEPYDEGN